MKAHTVCLAKEFLKKEPSAIMPVEGECPGCLRRMLWGDLIRRFNGALELVEAPPEDGEDEDVSDVSSVDEEGD